MVIAGIGLGDVIAAVVDQLPVKQQPKSVKGAFLILEIDEFEPIMSGRDDR